MVITSSKKYFGEGTGVVIKTKNFLFDAYITQHFRFKFSTIPKSKYIVILLWVGPFALEVTRNLEYFQRDTYLNETNFKSFREVWKDRS